MTQVFYELEDLIVLIYCYNGIKYKWKILGLTYLKLRDKFFFFFLVCESVNDITNFSSPKIYKFVLNSKDV